MAHNEQEPEFQVGFAAALPVEHRINADGSDDVIFKAVGTSEKAVDHLIKNIAEATGGTAEKLVHGPDSSRSGTVFFSAGHWSATWEPKGPKPNWGPPKDPRLN